MEWQAWLILYAIPLLEHIPEFLPYLRNFALLRDIYLIARSWSISSADLIKLRSLCVEFVRTYQELYYSGVNERIFVMGINIHLLLYLGVFSYTKTPRLRSSTKFIQPI